MVKFDYLAFADIAESRWGLTRSSLGSVFGVIEGQPVHLFEGTDNGGKAVFGIAVGVDSESAAESTKTQWINEIPFLKSSMVDAEPDNVVAAVPAGVVARLTRDELALRIEQMVATAVRLGRVEGSRGSRPALVNSVPMFLTESEAHDYKLYGEMAATEYAELGVRWVPGIALGLLATAVSAVVWAGLAVATEREFWLVAIGAGLLIALATVKGAEKTNIALQGVIGLMTIASVFLGQILSIWWVLKTEFIIVDVGDIVSLYGIVVEEDVGTLLFALGGGLIGAWYGARFASKPQLVPEIELAPAT